MVMELPSEERVIEKLKRQLAKAVRDIQWSYAIFWSISHEQPGVLKWSDGYYNGDIKTRKTLQAVELNADEMGLQRSEQLRELYESLSAGESSQVVPRRPSAALSPEDLSDAEWYYLVCMSFVFNLGQGLPGRALANGQPIWLYNAHSADSKVFGRSLLARSASIQTVICFPFLRGVIELGVSDQVLEDNTLIQNFKMSILEVPNPSSKDLNFLSVNKSSEDLEPNRLTKESIMLEGATASQVQSWQIVEEDELSNCVNNSMDSSDCVSQTLVEPEPAQKVLDHKNTDAKIEMNTKTGLVLSEDLHYRSIMATLFKDSNLNEPRFQNLNREKSSFARWKRGAFRKRVSRDGASSQRLIKKILFEVPRMYVKCDVESPEENRNDEEDEEIGVDQAALEWDRRERLDEKFSVLKTMVPSLSKDDKMSILDDAIEYLRKLERRVEDLESRRKMHGSEQKTRRKSREDKEETSDNYGSKKIGDGKRPLANKRKVCDIETNHASSEDIAVRMKNKEIVIEVKCPWRDGVLLEIMDALGDLNIDSHSVQSSTNEGVISLTIKSKIKGSTAMSGMRIKQALKRVTRSKVL